MKTNKVIKPGIALLLSLVLYACHGKEDDASKIVNPKFDPLMHTIVVSESEIPIYYEVVGTINAKTRTTLSSKVPGNITDVKREEGDTVKSGTLLAVIDDRDINTKLEQAKSRFDSAEQALNEIESSINQAKTRKTQAEANLSLAQSTYDRFEQLYKEKATSAQEFDAVKAKLKVAKAQVETAQQGITQLGFKKEQVNASINQARSAVEEANIMRTYTQITAPFDGVIVKKHVEVGGLAVPGMPLFTIENPDGFRLEVDVREQEFTSKARLGCEVDVQIDALGDDFIKGHVAEIVPSANPMSRSFRVKIAIPAMDGLKSGMYGKAICEKDIKKGILIPRAAIVQRGQLEQVFTVDEKQIARMKLIKSGKIYRQNIEVLAGLSQGDRLIIDPQPGLRDLYQVKVEVQK